MKDIKTIILGLGAFVLFCFHALILMRLIQVLSQLL